MRTKPQIESTIENLEKLLKSGLLKNSFDTAYVLGAKHALRWLVDPNHQDIMVLAKLGINKAI